MFNRHKIKRKYRRRKRVKKKNSAIHSGRKDFAWRGKRRNPIQAHVSSRCSPKVKLYIGLLLLCAIGMLWTLVYHSFFHVKDIQIEGIERLSTTEVQSSVEGVISHKKFAAFPGESYFFVDTAEIAEILLDKFPLHDVAITKQFPNALTIHLTERLSTIVFDNTHTYYTVGLTGRVVEPIRKVTDAEWLIQTEFVTTTNDIGEEVSEEKEVSRRHIPDVQGVLRDVGNYPIILKVGDTQETLDINTEVLPEEHVTALITWYEFLSKKKLLAPRYIDVTSSHDSIIYTAGPSIHISLVGEYQPQIERLETALQQIDNSSSIGYIDIRFPGKVYWQ